MKVIHICGESGVGKNYLLTAIRALETKHNANIELNKFENTFLARFEITNPFTVLKPVKGEVSLVNLRDKIEGLIDKDKHETIIHHWQYSSHRLFYHINRIAPEVRQKIFLLWRDWEYHLGDLYGRERKFGKKWDKKKLKNLFVEFYDSLCPVKMSNRCMKKLIAHSSGKIVPKEDLEMYKKELDIDIEVVENISIPVYCTISGTDLDKLIK